MDPDILTDEQLHRSFWDRMWEITKNYIPLGYITFGGPAAHVGMLHDRFVVKQKWIPDDVFGELFGLAQSLPGPASTQLAYAIAQLRDGIGPAIWGFILWTTPCWLVMTVFAYIVANVSSNLPQVVIYIENGLVASAVGLVGLAAYRLGLSLCKTDFNRLLALITFGFTINYADIVWLYPVEMAIGGLLSWIWLTWGEAWIEGLVDRWKKRRVKTQEIPLEEVKENGAEIDVEIEVAVEETKQQAVVEPLIPPEDHPLHTSYGWKTGVVILALWVILLVVSAIVRGISLPDRSLEVLATFWFIGSTIFGGGPVVIPLLAAFIITPGWATEREFLLGLAVINILPGPNFCFGSYCGGLAMRWNVGALIGGALLAAVGMFVPAIMLMAGLIPLWQKYRKYPAINRVLSGVNASAAGLVFAVTYQLYEHAYTDPLGDGTSRAGSLGAHPLLVTLAAITFIFGGVMTNIAIPAPLLIIFGGLVGVFMWLGAGMP